MAGSDECLGVFSGSVRKRLRFVKWLSGTAIKASSEFAAVGTSAYADCNLAAHSANSIALANWLDSLRGARECHLFPLGDNEEFLIWTINLCNFLACLPRGRGEWGSLSAALFRPRGPCIDIGQELLATTMPLSFAPNLATQARRLVSMAVEESFS